YTHHGAPKNKAPPSPQDFARIIPQYALQFFQALMVSMSRKFCVAVKFFDNARYRICISDERHQESVQSNTGFDSLGLHFAIFWSLTEVYSASQNLQRHANCKILPSSKQSTGL